MRFGPWYPLAEAGDHAPAAEGILQVRLATGLVEYPRGKSAMLWYEHAPDTRAAALALATAHAHNDLVCRHLIEIEDATDLAAFCARLMTEFVRRFGTRPIYHR
ncbi:MAG: hypothetical protein H0T42_20570 [Deltaproteobacteria bacterium]|nr:hypothetical protein [Deltaproteobacteria bacterium]